ncbi:glycosyltransferase family 4 protein [Thomasclavelia spiroformis]|uniref:glycosyltransferase family 4 protein n=1 Tax=Thomasclavelia spiroformis TaxID=29348 RepID=UPI0026DCB5AF|nr:glycosyltransferase family 4 protein [Thomasclavelia spiroformis]
MKILWIINGLTFTQRQNKALVTPIMSSWVEALINSIYLSKHEFDVLYPALEVKKEVFIENGVKYIPFEINSKFRSLNNYNFSQYDVIHLWGLEYDYISDFIQFLDIQNMLGKVILSIQGICEYIGLHYCEGLPYKIAHRKTLRDWIKRDNIIAQQKMFLNKAKIEKYNLKKLKHISGRTTFDEQYVKINSPDTRYYHCEEGLRQEFYKLKWDILKCKKNRIFMSQGYYSIKGLHIALEALNSLKQIVPDIELVVAGMNPVPNKKHKDSSYARYIRNIIKKYNLENSVKFLGQLSQKEMVEEYLKCHVFILPSLIENSPNSVCEAMLLGVPTVASYVGGVPDLIKHKETGYLYQWNASYMLASHLKELLASDKLCQNIGMEAREVALYRHDIKRIIERWDLIYEIIDKQSKNHW